MKLTKITAAAVAALTLGGTVASTGVASADTLGNQTQGDVGQFLEQTSNPTLLDALKDISAQAQQGTGSLAVYRMYNPNSGEHFYTVSSYEAASLLFDGWHYEGTLGVTATSGQAVIRLYNPNAGVHYYTGSEVEARALVAKGWVDEGIAMIDSGSAAVYGAYNPNNSQHNFTTFAAEETSLVNAGWLRNGNLNGVEFHLLAVGTSFGSTASGGFAGSGTVNNGDPLQPATPGVPVPAPGGEPSVSK